MTGFIIKRLPYNLSFHAGLAFVGKYLKCININALGDSAFPVRSNSEDSFMFSEIRGIFPQFRTTGRSNMSCFQTK